MFSYKDILHFQPSTLQKDAIVPLENLLASMGVEAVPSLHLFVYSFCFQT